MPSVLRFSFHLINSANKIIKRMSNTMATHNTIMIVIRFVSQKVSSSVIVGLWLVEVVFPGIDDADIDGVVASVVNIVGVTLLTCISTCLFLPFDIKYSPRV